MATNPPRQSPSRVEPPAVAFFANAPDVHGYAAVCGILAIAPAIAGFLVPVIGVLFITPVAIVFNSAALYGGYRRVALVTLVIVLVNLMVSPTRWLSVAAGAAVSDAAPNRFPSYFDLAGVVAMFCLVAWPRRVTLTRGF